MDGVYSVLDDFAMQAADAAGSDELAAIIETEPEVADAAPPNTEVTKPDASTEQTGVIAPIVRPDDAADSSNGGGEPAHPN